MIRKNIYKWHRISSLIIAIPVLLWAISGFMHPLMTTIKPQMATQTLIPQPIDSTKLETPIPLALAQNRIQQFHTLRLVHIDTNWFYQVQPENGMPPVYLSTKNGKRLRNGDQLYAQYIAKQLLQGQPKQDTISMVAPAMQEMQQDASAHDCCDAATSCVLADSTGALVESVELITNFNKEYKYVNKLLPVYKVQFDRADGIRVYVETTQDRFAYAVDNRRAGFDAFFGLCHTWDWLNDAGQFKYLLMGVFTGLGFLTTIMGLYIFFITKTKNGKTPIAKTRRMHRIVSLIASLFTLMFTFSGGLHALEKLKTPAPIADNLSNAIPAQAATLDYGKLQAAIGDPVGDLSITRIDSAFYWRMRTTNRKVEYVHAGHYNVLPNGEELHAISLASAFSGYAGRDIVKMERIIKFAGEYGFVNKRLPVWKLTYASNSNERYYVETSTGKCAARFSDKDLFEGYSFALLHKHHFMDWAGKSARDISTMIAAALQVIMILVGLFLFYRWIKR